MTSTTTESGIFKMFKGNRVWHNSIVPNGRVQFGAMGCTMNHFNVNYPHASKHRFNIVREILVARQK